MRISVRFMTLRGAFRVATEESFQTMLSARKAVESYADSAGFTNVRVVEDSDGWRFTADPPDGGRRGRNIAYAEHDVDGGMAGAALGSFGDALGAPVYTDCRNCGTSDHRGYACPCACHDTKLQTWNQVVAAARRGARLYYKAPLDHRAVRVAVRVVGEKLLVTPPAGSGADPFTADAGHLDRFRLRP